MFEFSHLSDITYIASFCKYSGLTLVCMGLFIVVYGRLKAPGAETP